MKIEITQTQMNLMLAAVEHGFKARERGQNLEAALLGVMDLYAVVPPKYPLGSALIDRDSISREAGPVPL